jgi:branched-chain amino acid transport system permease protein
MAKFIALFASGLSYGALVALVALGLLVLVKATGVVNLAHGELITAGGFLAIWGTKDLHLPLLLAYLVALIALAVISLLLELLINGPLRGKSPNVILVATLGIGLVIRALFALWQGSDPHKLAGPVGTGSVHIGGAAIDYQRILVIVVAAIAITGAVTMFAKTDFGRQVRALATDEETARLCGIRVKRVSRLAFITSAVLAGIVGLLLGPTNGVDLTFGFNIMLVAFAAAVIGGFGSLWGTTVAALAIGFLQQLLGGYIFTDYADTLPFVAMLIAVVARPKGVLSATRLVRV